ncbi:MAG: hypothetical protein GW748_00615 [Alphaproteobacteria bacterium]|nr:hypothetical protein [Alphaproteobacteria bacterium]NCQ66235.1 hypothetical protein [Alphaproteobacteria bacterium]NCT06583.1 hypothetical protein [Alphaproteobacteria bacterium]
MLEITNDIPDEVGYIQAVTFSDTIIISVTADIDTAVSWLVRTSDKIQAVIFKILGLLSRGIIHEGELIHDKNFIFGEGLIQAYKMEQKFLHPAIYFSKEFIREYIPQLPKYFSNEDSDHWSEEMAKLCHQGYFDQDCDGIFLSQKVIFSSENREKTLEKIKAGLESSESEHQKSKWRWLNQRYDLLNNH